MNDSQLNSTAPDGAENVVPAQAPKMKAAKEHTAYSASLLLMFSSLLSGLLALVRQKLVAKYFGASGATAAYVGAFELPDMIQYLLVGGVASITLVTLLSRYHESGRDEEGDKALSVILNTIFVLIAVVLVFAWIFAPQYVAVKFPHFKKEEIDLCVHLTRILMPGPLFFFAGGIFASRLLVRKIFLYQALMPIVYSSGVVAGAIFLHGRIGIDSLAVGAITGAFLGFLGINYFGARKVGMRWYPLWDLKHPALREYLRLSLPVMLGASLPTADGWIRTYFASSNVDSMAQLSFARQLFTAPMSMLGAAAGAASLPFFASLWGQGKKKEFAGVVNRAVSRLMSVSILASGWMIALAVPLTDVTLRGGSFAVSDAVATANYLTLFSFALLCWTSQGIYARAFYGAGNTLTPMVSGTIVTLLAIPVYALLFHRMGMIGLVWATDIGILAHAVSLAVLLHRSGMVSIGGLEWGELGRALIASLLGAGAIAGLLRVLPVPHNHLGNLIHIAGASVLWIAVCLAVLLLMRSKLPKQLFRLRG